MINTNEADARKRSTGLAGMTNLNLLAPIRRDMVQGFEPISYRERLRKVLDALQAARRNVRESELLPSLFGDAVGQFNIIHNFRYAIVPPVPGAGTQQPIDGTWHLSLNVSFDGGWEPYMRVIYRDLGMLLDLLLCHTQDYPGSAQSNFNDYCAWVRRHEVEGGIFYSDSAATLEDQRYLAELEELLSEGNCSDLSLARFARPTGPQRVAAAHQAAMKNPRAALMLPLRTLKGLHRLSVYFGDDRHILRRFAREVLIASRKVMADLEALPASDPRSAFMPRLRLLLVDELALIEPLADKPAVGPDLEKPDARRLQAHMLAQGEGITHGCVVLLRITSPEQATAHITRLATHCGPLTKGAVGCLVAFTYAGLQHLGVAPESLAAFPQEFVDGMEARCGLLGDVRGNHPDYWPRPLVYPAGGHRVEMQSVHLMVQLRVADPDAWQIELHPLLQAAVDELNEPGAGLKVLAMQATRSIRAQFKLPDQSEVQHVTGHFGFADGLSQPVLDVGQAGLDQVADRDRVPTGELLLGYANGRGDDADPALPALLKDGSFLAVRKLRQHVDKLHANMKDMDATARETLLARMMGRPKDGSPPLPLVAHAKSSNDFDYAAPNASDVCPFQSHVRRANPRDGRDYIPRILRRGMSYGAIDQQDLTAERGVVFMAYCASLAEQFETVQRWIAGGNSTGVSSSQADPFLRVPQHGKDHHFRYVDDSGTVQHKVFNSQPLVQLEWGLYLFVPALTVLADLAAFTDPAARHSTRLASVPTEPAAADELEQMRQLMDDPQRATEIWKQVRAGKSNAATNTAYGRLLGTSKEVLAALKDGDAKSCSVEGYGQRMKDSVGLNHLGQDHVAGKNTGDAINAVILKFTEQVAFDLASLVVLETLQSFNEPLPSPSDAVSRSPVDLVTFSDRVMADLCHRLIGLPDSLEPKQSIYMEPGGRNPVHTGLPRCPGNFASASRYIFSPHPRPAVVAEGQAQGVAVGQAVHNWLKDGGKLGRLAIDIKDALGGATVTPEVLGPSLAGILLGFPPTVQGNFIKIAENWIQSSALWDHQQALAEANPKRLVSYEHARRVLRAELIKTMRQRPVPDVLWRTPKVDGQVKDDPGLQWILGIGSALADPSAPDELLFGRDSAKAATPTAHGCPGMDMAMGVLLAMFAGLLQAGSWRPTGSPVLLVLSRTS